MNRLLKLTTLVLALCILWGCSGGNGSHVITSSELTITLPASFQDLSAEYGSEGVELLYGSGNCTILVVKEEKSILADLISGMDAVRYAQLFLESNRLPDKVEIADGIPSFTYTTASGGAEITYLCGVFESRSYFWLVQAYCATDAFAENQQDLWSCITSVTVK